MVLGVCVGFGAALGGCATSSSTEWAQTAPPIAPAQTSAKVISLGPWGKRDLADAMAVAAVVD